MSDRLLLESGDAALLEDASAVLISPFAPPTPSARTTLRLADNAAFTALDSLDSILGLDMNSSNPNLADPDAALTIDG